MNFIKRMFKKLDDWNPLTLLMSRIEVAAGFALAVMAGLDWSQLVTLGAASVVSWQSIATVGGILVARGVFYELARRFNTKDEM